MVEEWRDILGYEGQYQVSNLGRVRSLDRVINHPVNGPMRRRGGIHRCGKSKGYLNVSLLRDGKTRTFTVHRLVALAFVGPPTEQIRHLDGDKYNNAATNLAWGTAAENSADREKHGNTARGERSGVATKTEAQVRLIKFMHEQGYGPTAIGRLIGLSKARVHEVTSGKVWRHVSI